MAKVTSKLQVTVPKAIAAAATGFRPGDEIEWVAAGRYDPRAAPVSSGGAERPTSKSGFGCLTRRPSASASGRPARARSAVPAVTEDGNGTDLYERARPR